MAGDSIGCQGEVVGHDLGSLSCTEPRVSMESRVGPFLALDRGEPGNVQGEESRKSEVEKAEWKSMKRPSSRKEPRDWVVLGGGPRYA